MLFRNNINMERRVIVITRNDTPNVRWIFTSVTKACKLFPDIKEFIANVWHELKHSENSTYIDSDYTISREPLNPDNNF